MGLRAALLLIARTAFALFVLVFSFFCILAYLPYSYVAFTHNPPIPVLRSGRCGRPTPRGSRSAAG